MYQIQDVVMYRRVVSTVVDIKRDRRKKQTYYILEPYHTTGPSTRFEVPVENKAGHLKPLMTQSELEELIVQIPSIEIVTLNTSNVKTEYDSLLNSGSREDLIRLIKTTYMRNQHRLSVNKKIGVIDDNYFRRAEQYLYEECSAVLNKSLEDTRAYFRERMRALNNTESWKS
ncbi:MAG: hypothetical protein HUJ56_02930 [Erysipelotrichaceae bacterium]|nr:hypothetical protein [Erysipelotrichaceae bacterium]